MRLEVQKLCEPVNILGIVEDQKKDPHKLEASKMASHKFLFALKKFLSRLSSIKEIIHEDDARHQVLSDYE